MVEVSTSVGKCSLDETDVEIRKNESYCIEGDHGANPDTYKLDGVIGASSCSIKICKLHKEFSEENISS